MRFCPGRCAFALMLLFDLFARPLHAQSSNVDLVKMIQAGLPESTVVNKIHERAGQWDTSVDALIALKKDGATAAELDALTQALPAPRAPAAPLPASIPAFDGMLGYTGSGVPYIQFPAGVLLPTLTGEPSNRVYLMRDNGQALVVIPSSFASINNAIVPTGLHFASVFQWDGSAEGNLLWSATDVRFENICLVPDVSVGIKDRAAAAKIRENPNELLDQFFAEKKQVVHIYAPLGFREKQSLYYLGTLDKKDKLTGYVFTVGLQGYTWAGRGSNEPAGVQFRSPQLQAFIDKLIEHPDAILGEFATAANLPADAGSWPPSLDYVYSTKDSARHYAGVNANYVAEIKANQPPSGGGGFGSFLNVMQGVQNMANAQSMANVAAANHDMSGQLNAALSAGQAELQTLNAIGNPSAPAIQPNYSAQPSIQATANQQVAAIQAKQAAAAVQTPQKTVAVAPKGNQPPAMQKNVQIASVTPPPGSGTAPPPSCVDLGPGNCMPLAQYQQLQAQKLAAQQAAATSPGICPASGYIIGPGYYAASDAYLGSRINCTPGQPVSSGKPGGGGASVSAVAGSGAGCQNVNTLVEVNSSWFQSNPANKEVVAFVSNHAKTKVTCTIAFDGGTQWVDYGTGTYNVGDTNKGGQGGGLWHMGAATSRVHYACFAGDTPTDAKGNPCNANMAFSYP